MSDKKHEPGMAYNTKTLNKVFALLSVLFLISVLWMMFEDYFRPWKKYQLDAMKIEQEVLKKSLSDLEKELDGKKVGELEESVKKAKASLESKKSEMNSIEDKISEVKGKLQEIKLRSGSLGGFVSELKYNWEMAHDHHSDSDHTKHLREELDTKSKAWEESKDTLKGFMAAEKNLIKQKDALKADLVKSEASLKAYIGKIETFKKGIAKTQIEKRPIDILRNLPFIDFMDPTIKIRQVQIHTALDDRSFQAVPRVDRCMTCHTFIDRKGFEDQPQPYKTHPNLDLMVGSESNHPMTEFGCTTCHGGEGHRVSNFTAVAHTPQNEKQKKEWEEKYNWEAPHRIPQPMFKLQYTESQCLKCHQATAQSSHVPQAHKLNEGRKLFKTYGCYSCHKVQGQEWLGKAGPSLEKIKGKVTKEFAKNWVWDPYAFNPNSKMPAFFNQSNNSKKEHKEKNVAEVHAMVDYIWNTSKGYNPPVKYTGGDLKKGKELIQTVGCIGCHQIKGIDSDYAKAKGRRGPYLQGLGSKLNGDFLVSWLIQPSHYSKETIMPSFRLSPKEANDIATFLLADKNKDFQERKMTGAKPEVRDEILLTYYSAFDTQKVARNKLEAMTPAQRHADLGKRSIQKYGCYSCHTIKGFEGLPPIGPELTHEGSKFVTQFGFGHQKVEHSRDAWIKAHLINPRRWDIGVEKPFKDLTRMPNFNLKEEEAELLTLAILGQVNEKIPEKGIYKLPPHQKIAQKHFETLQHFNCIGCHRVDGMGGDILAMYDQELGDITLGPPQLIHEGERVKGPWLRKFLSNVHPIRPWLEIRMPSYNLNYKNKEEIAGYFRENVNAPVHERKFTVSWSPGERAGAKALWDDYACVSCHSTGFNNDSPQAPNLFMANERLRFDWIKSWLKNPQKYIPGTTMPNFFEDGEAQNDEVFSGNIEKQVNALAKYVYELGQGKNVIAPFRKYELGTQKQKENKVKKLSKKRKVNLKKDPVTVQVGR